MFINGKELNDLPGIGFVEGMACGCAYIGRVDPMFIDIGLKPGMHYIGYDGTLQDLKKKIKYYQEHPKKLEKIANNGYEFATKNFNSEIVAEKFYRDLQKLINNYKNNGYNKTNIKFKSSFIVN
jgi:glycosyltransferase involved in cell wall biosynthesis